MNSNKCPRAFAIEIKVTDMKLSPGLGQSLFVSAVDRAGQAKLRIIRDSQRVVVVVCLNDRQHGSKNLFLFDGCTGLHVGNHSRLDKETLLAIGTAAAHYPAAFGFAFLDVA